MTPNPPLNRKLTTEHEDAMRVMELVNRFLLARQAGRWDMEAHNLLVEEMEKHHGIFGAWVDPVSKRPFPPGRQMKRDPNRAERRLLEYWRRTGRT